MGKKMESSPEAGTKTVSPPITEKIHIFEQQIDQNGDNFANEGPNSVFM
jgi:hypothetical protein